MKPLPRILIMGRPNVGKSTLLNRYLRKKHAITVDEPGVTRDITEHRVDDGERQFMLIDSGGVMFSDAKDEYLQDEIEARVALEMTKADRILFLTDVTQGVHPLDTTIAKTLRKVKDKVILVANKSDNPDRDIQASALYRLGLGDPIPISALNGLGMEQLLGLALKGLKNVPIDEAVPDIYNIALVGRPNVGKSSLINAILNEDRVIVDSKAGTTRDAVPHFFQTDQKRFIFVDTAGMRRKAKVKESIEFFSVIRAKRAIQEADCVIVVLDANDFLMDQDKKIIQMVIQEHRNVMIFVNKWDLTERTDDNRRGLTEIAHHEFPFLQYVPFIFGSAKEGHHVGKLFNLIPDVIRRSEVRISTPKLNQFIQTIVKKNPPPAKYGKQLKVIYATQVDVMPPTFICFVNNNKNVSEPYRRFLEKRLREHFGGFEGVPLVFNFRNRESS